MTNILVRPPELRQISEQLRSSANKISAALQAIDNDILSLKGDRFLGNHANTVQMHYAPKREALLRAKNIILHFADDLQHAATVFEQADKGGNKVNNVGSSKWDLDKNMEFEKKNGELYKKGDGDSSDVQYDDIKQQGIEDCYLMASLATLAKKDPNLIKDMIKDNGDGTYTVRFFEDGKPVYITVDAEVPVNKMFCITTGEKYGTSTDKDELWPSIVEKAFAKWKGGYDEIRWNSPKMALEALTGKPAEQLYVALAVIDEETGKSVYVQGTNFRENLETALKNGDPVVLGTVESPTNSVLSGKHAYMVERIDGDTLYLYNPWGEHCSINLNSLQGNVSTLYVSELSGTHYENKYDVLPVPTPVI